MIMKKKRVLFVASLPNKKSKFDGERNKSGDILKVFRKNADYKLSIVDYTKNKYIQSLKLVLLCLFFRFNRIFVSKCIVGGSVALHIINTIVKGKTKLYYYLIGNGYYGFDEKKIHFSDILKCDEVIVESENVVEMMEHKGLPRKKMHVFPCIKPNYDIDVLEKNYNKKAPLHLIYFSRINPDKGLGDLLEAIIDINENCEKPILILDISGGVTQVKYDMDFNELVLKECKNHSYLHYLGLSLTINGIESYKALQKYDLHVFPSRFDQECAPGSIIDMFIAGIPTLSSNFPSAKYLLNDDNSFFFNFKDVDDLKRQLLYIYNNPTELTNRRFLSHQEYKKYNEDSFLDFLARIGFYE